MQHTDPDQLALVALGESSDGDDPEVVTHLRQCALCQAEVEALRFTVDLARETVGLRTEDPRPPEAVWARIAAELDLPAESRSDPPPDDARPSDPAHGASDERTAPDFLNAVGRRPGEATADGGNPEPAARPGRRLERRVVPAGRRRWTRSVTALVAAVAVGVVGTLVAVRPWQNGTTTPTVTSSARLRPVTGGPGGASGRVVVVQGGSGPELDVTAAGLPLQQGYYEVWVFDGEQSMVSVGVLGGNSAASLPLPLTLDLRRYNVVDISQERYDGDQTHSQVSVLRGTLTD